MPTRTTCPYCGVGCGVVAERAPDGTVRVAGDPAHPANLGRLCSKGNNLAETLGPEDRLLVPQVHGRPATWDHALGVAADGLRRIVDEHGPDAVAFYVSGQLLTEDYYVANKLMKGFLGSANIDANSRLCMASAVAGHKRALGTDTVPVGYDDLEAADLVVFVGSNAAECHPIVFRRVIAERERRPRLKVVAIDPRATPTSDEADLHLKLLPGSDTVLFAGLLEFLRAQDALDFEFLEAHTTGFGKALAAAREAAPSIPAVAAATGLSPDDLATFYGWFARTARTVTLWSMGTNQASDGTDRVQAILNVHLATGRIGKPGAGPFSLTGQPNAMGGREVGALANLVAAHHDFDDLAGVDRVARFWGADRLARAPGARAVAMFRRLEQGDIKAVWIMATNPVVSLPDADRVRRALAKAELVVVSEPFARNDTLPYAHVAFPAAAWGEKDGTVTNSERRISRCRPFLPAPGEARPDWWIVGEVAKRLGFGRAFAFTGPAQIFDEHARLSAFENDGGRLFDLSGLVGLSPEAYDALEPVRWPVRAGDGDGAPSRPFADGVFPTPDGRARLHPVIPRPSPAPTDDRFPLVLNTGRVRDHWHTMTRTGRSPSLSGTTYEPYADVHPDDAVAAGAADGTLVRVSGRDGSTVVRARVRPDQRRGAVFVPMHWTSVTSSHGRVNAAVHDEVDPVSAQPDFKRTPVRIEPFEVAWYGFVMAREEVATGGLDHWVRVRGEGHVRYEIAGGTRLRDPGGWARELLGLDAWIELTDSRRGTWRGAKLSGDRLEATVFLGPEPQLPSRDWLAGLFARDALDLADRRSLLAGRPLPGAEGVQGPLLCVCHRVRVPAVAALVVSGGARTAEEVGAACGAGTGCGSCLSSIRDLIGRLLPSAVPFPALLEAP